MTDIIYIEFRVFNDIIYNYICSSLKLGLEFV